MARQQPEEREVAEEEVRFERRVQLAQEEHDGGPGETGCEASADHSPRPDELQREEHEERDLVEPHHDDGELDACCLAHRGHMQVREEVVVERLAGDHRQRDRPVVKRLTGERDREHRVLLVRRARDVSGKRHLRESDHRRIEQEQGADDRARPDRRERCAVPLVVSARRTGSIVSAMRGAPRECRRAADTQRRDSARLPRPSPRRPRSRVGIPASSRGRAVEAGLRARS